MSNPILKSFTFVPQPKLIIKRERMIARLEDQQKLLADANYVRIARPRAKTTIFAISGIALGHMVSAASAIAAS
jgi:hypothetical protein